MQIEEIQVEWSKDSHIRKDKLDHELLKIPQLLYKYQNFLYLETEIFRKLDAKNKKIFLLLFQYYNGFLSKEKLEKIKRPQFSQRILKNDIKTYIEADDLYQESLSILEQAHDRIEFLKQIIKHLDNRSYNIKTTIEYLKWTNGMM